MSHVGPPREKPFFVCLLFFVAFVHGRFPRQINLPLFFFFAAGVPLQRQAASPPAFWWHFLRLFLRGPWKGVAYVSPPPPPHVIGGTGRKYQSICGVKGVRFVGIAQSPAQTHARTGHVGPGTPAARETNYSVGES